MKKTTILFVILVAWLPWLIGAWDATKPVAGRKARFIDDDIRANNAGIEAALDQDHDFTTGGTMTGKHDQVTFNDPLGSAPATVAASEGVLYLLDVSSKAELHFEDEDENTIQLTSLGDRLANATYFTATDNAGTGSVNVFKVHTDDTIHFGTDATVNGALTVTDNVTMATGMTLTAETITAVDATGILLRNDTPATVITIEDDGTATLADGSTLATSAAPVNDVDLANKKYVDDQVAAVDSADDMTPTAYAGEESITLANGLIMKVGGPVSQGTVTFGTAFPTGLMGVFCQQVGTLDRNANVHIKNQSVSGFTIDGEDTIYWFAIGY